MENNYYLYKVYRNQYVELIAKDIDSELIRAYYNNEVAHYFHGFFESPKIKTYYAFLEYFTDELKEKLQVDILTDSKVLQFFVDQVVYRSTSYKISKKQLFTDFIHGKSCFFIGKSFDGCFYFFETKDNVVQYYRFETFREENGSLFKLFVTSDKNLDSVGFKQEFNIDKHKFTLYDSDFSRKL